MSQDLLNIIYAVLALSVMGLAFGLLLALASKVFHVETDERLPLVLECLPGANCGGCGYPGCSNLAGAIIAGKAPANACPVGGADCAEKIAAIMGTDAGDSVRCVAHVNCRGGFNAKRKYEYEGLSDCLAASKVAGGPLECGYGCFGLGTCASVCPFNAIEMLNGVAIVHADKCTACKKCVDACPRHIIKLVPETADVMISCSSMDRGAILQKICNIGCIGCRLCVKACKSDAITVEDNLAHIDYSKCTNCGECAKVCPRKLIINASEVTSETSKRLA